MSRLVLSGGLIALYIAVADEQHEQWPCILFFSGTPCTTLNWSAWALRNPRDYRCQQLCHGPNCKHHRIIPAQNEHHPEWVLNQGPLT